MSTWIDALARLAGEDVAAVVVTVAAAKGSTPREAGTKMVVTEAETIGTIGGGHLELMATEAAREMLAEGAAAETRLRRVSLGPELGQCCGGNTTLLLEPVGAAADGEWLAALAEAWDGGRPCVLVTRAEGAPGARMVVNGQAVRGGLGGGALDAGAVARAREMLAGGDDGAALEEIEGAMLLFEPVRPPDLNIVLFGAGHVGRALVQVLAGLPCRLAWFDSRDNMFPEERWANVVMEVTEAPEHDVDEAPPGSFFLVMTHSHALDLKLCERILKRGDFAYFGLIGSRTKRRRFEKRLLHKGIDPRTIGRMTCPIGVPGISGKHPREIAIAVAAEILSERQRIARADGDGGRVAASAG